jgi:Domain of unknown function (DUF4112)
MPAPPDPDPHVARAETLARWLDDRWLDPILGLLLPGAGDAIGALLSLYIVGIAIRRRVPAAAIARMLLNIGIDTAVGAVPVLGDLFDFAWKANRKNLALLRARPSRPGRWSDRLVLAGAAALLVGVVAAVVLGVRWLWLTGCHALDMPHP